MTAAELRALQALAERAALAGAGVLRGFVGRIGRVDAKTSDTDPVTAADRASETAIAELLREARPDDGFMGEEERADSEAVSGVRWVVDPLDGTVNFVYGHVGWGVSVACQQRRDGVWETVAGVVHDSSRDELFSAARGLGATLNTVALRVNDPVALERALVSTGFGYDRDDRRIQAEVAARVIVAARDLRRVGSAALDLCAVASGRVDGYYEDTVKLWDIAAGSLIAAEAGAVVAEYPAVRRDSIGICAAGPALQPDLLALVSRPRTPPADRSPAR